MTAIIIIIIIHILLYQKHDYIHYCYILMAKYY